MSTVIHCSGHRFKARRPMNPFGITNEWMCRLCGLRVHTLEAVQYLTGKRS